MDQPGILVSLKHSHLSQKHSHAEKSCLLSLQDRWTHTQPPLEKRTRFKTNYYIYACVRALCSNVRATLYTAMWIYVRGILREETVGRHAALYMLYVPGTETFAANGCHYRKRGLQKSESLRAGLRYCCCGLGDNYLMNKLPKPLAKHTSYST